jgi:uncharacterized protein with HEPN domain
MQKDDLIYVSHMIDLATSAVNKVDPITRERFDSDENLRLALTHLVQTLGEAARRVSPEFQQRYPAIPWAKIVGMRHKVVHDYLHVDYDIVWDVATHELPPLIRELRKIVPSQE